LPRWPSGIAALAFRDCAAFGVIPVLRATGLAGYPAGPPVFARCGPSGQCGRARPYRLSV